MEGVCSRFLVRVRERAIEGCFWGRLGTRRRKGAKPGFRGEAGFGEILPNVRNCLEYGCNSRHHQASFRCTWEVHYD